MEFSNVPSWFCILHMTETFLSFAAELGQTTCENVGGDGPSEGVYKATGPAAWFHRPRCSFHRTFSSLPLAAFHSLLFQVTGGREQAGWHLFLVYHQDRGGCTVEDFCNHIHRSLLKDVKYVLVWGTSARHYPQHCGLGHGLNDEDVVQIVKKKVVVWFGHISWITNCYVSRLCQSIAAAKALKHVC
jgi:hypothetical protein